MDTDRTVFSIEQLLDKGLDQNYFSSLSVALTISKESLNFPNGQLILTFLINLLIRLSPVIKSINLYASETPTKIILPKWHRESILGYIGNIYDMTKTQLKLKINDKPEETFDICIVIGDDNTNDIQAKRKLFIGSNGWKAILSPDKPVFLGERCNQIGAYTTVVLACSEIFKSFLYPKREMIRSVFIRPLENEFQFSTFDYSVNNENSLNPEIPAVVDVKKLTLIGVGAGGGAALYTLSSLNDLRGLITLIDSDKIESHNLNRYIIADNLDIGKSKVALGAEVLQRHRNVTTKQLPGAFINEKIKLLRDEMEYVLSAVHSREARLQIQFETPKIIWDGAATERGEFEIWRIQFGKTQCMRCKHPEENNLEWKRAEGISKIIGLNPKTIFKKITNNEFFTEDEIIKIRNFCDKENLSFELPMEGQAISDWERNNCGKMNIPQIKEEVPIPFAPVMSGVLLAGEVIKEHYFPDNVLNSQYWNSLLGTFNKHIKPVLYKPKENCPLCKDPAIVNQYRRYWKT